MSGIAAVVLAAGASSRMGRPKALLPWRDTTLLEHELETLHAAGVERIVVVVGARAEAVRRAVGPAAPLVFNPRWASGRATSLARGARELLRGEAPVAVLVQNVDQPTTAEVVTRLGAALESSRADAVQPRYVDGEGREHGGHPVLIAGALLAALAGATEERQGLRGVLQGRRVERVAIEDPTVGLDLDTPEAYQAARAALGA